MILPIVASLLLIFPQVRIPGPGGKAAGGGGGTAPSVVQACKAVGSGLNSSANCTMGSNVTTGDKLYVEFFINAGGSTGQTISSSGTGCSGISWTGGAALQTFTGTSFNSYYANATVSGTGSCTITVSQTGTTADIDVIGIETSNDNGLDIGWTWHADGFQTNPVTQTINPTLNNDLILAGFNSNEGGTPSVNAPFALVTNGYNTSPSNVTAQYQQPTATSISATFGTMNGAQTNSFILAIKHP